VAVVAEQEEVVVEQAGEPEVDMTQIMN